jgi:osmotically-inducible protein OsmY
MNTKLITVESKRAGAGVSRWALVAALAAVPLLQGCFPLIAGGAAAGVLAVDDRRTLAIQAEDRTIYAKANSRIGERFPDRVNVSVTSFNRRVLLTGEVPDAATRAEVEKVAGGVENVALVINELQIGGLSSLTSRSNDAIITGKVKGNFVDDRETLANAFKVVTEASVVYLMGLVTREEGERAASVAARTSGVKQVVKVYEYIATAPRRADAPKQ